MDFQVGDTIFRIIDGVRFEARVITRGSVEGVILEIEYTDDGRRENNVDASELKHLDKVCSLR